MKLPAGFRPSKQQRIAFDSIENSTNSCFIYGAAGSGKSSFIQYFRNNTAKTTITLTFTGLAAILIGGQTIHSFFQLPPRILLKGDKEVKVKNKRLNQIKELDVLIIDEISTVSCDVLHSVDVLLREYRNNDVPFGGIQMVFIGDFFQISPVEPRGTNEWAAFKNDYKSVWFFDCEGYEDLDPDFIEFSHIHRQKDKELLNKLESIRQNQFDSTTLSYFNKRVGIKVPPSAIALCSTNKKVDEYNNTYLSKINRKSFTYIGISKNFKENEMPTDKELVLKEGARVMMIHNDPLKRWVNGSFAFISHLSKNKIKIKLIGLKNPKEHELELEKWKKYDYQLDKDYKQKLKKDRYKAVEIGFFKQYPIRIARASTIHKAQGQTFENILIDLDSGAFSHGQTYVALSRTKTYEGIHIKNHIKETDIKFDNKVVSYYNKNFKQLSLFDENPNLNNKQETLSNVEEEIIDF